MIKLFSLLENAGMRMTLKRMLNWKTALLVVSSLALTGCPTKKVVKKKPIRRAPVLTPAQIAQQQLDRGNALYKNGRQNGKVDYAGVEKSYKAVLRHNANHLVANFNLGAMFEEQGKYRDAATHFVRLANAPEHRKNVALQKKVLMRLAQVYVRMGQFAYAEQSLARYKQISPKWNKDVKYLQNASTVQIGRKQLDQALTSARRILALEASNINGYRLIARIYYLKRRYESVQTVFLIAQSKSTPDAGLYNICGLAWLKRKNLPKAAAYFREAVGKNPKHFAALMNLGMIAVRYQNKGEAVRLMKLATKARPNSRNAWLAYAVALRLNGKAAQAERIYTEVLLARNRNDAAAIYNLGLLFLRSVDEPTKARARFRQYIGVMGDRINRNHPVYNLLKQANRRIKIKQMMGPSKKSKARKTPPKGRS